MNRSRLGLKVVSNLRRSNSSRSLKLRRFRLIRCIRKSVFSSRQCSMLNVHPFCQPCKRNSRRQFRCHPWLRSICPQRCNPTADSVLLLLGHELVRVCQSKYCSIRLTATLLQFSPPKEPPSFESVWRHNNKIGCKNGEQYVDPVLKHCSR